MNAELHMVRAAIRERRVMRPTHTHTPHLHAHMQYSLPCFHLALNKAQAATLHLQTYMLISAAAQPRPRMHYCQNGIGQITVSNCVLFSLSKGDKRQKY